MLLHSSGLPTHSCISQYWFRMFRHFYLYSCCCPQYMAPHTRHSCPRLASLPSSVHNSVRIVIGTCRSWLPWQAQSTSCLNLVILLPHAQTASDHMLCVIPHTCSPPSGPCYFTISFPFHIMFPRTSAQYPYILPVSLRFINPFSVTVILSHPPQQSSLVHSYSQYFFQNSLN